MKTTALSSILWTAYGLPAPVTEHRFCDRMWRFDLAWPLCMIAVEIDGGIWSRGRHVRPAGYLGDLEKINTATRDGWRVFRFTPDQLQKGQAQAFVGPLLNSKPPSV